MSRNNLKWNDIKGIVQFYWEQRFFKLGFFLWLSVMIGSPFVLGLYDLTQTGRFQLDYQGSILFGAIAVILLPIFYFARNNE